jgi:hypothetical protein
MHVCTVQTVHRLYLSVSLQSQISSTNSRSFSLFFGPVRVSWFLCSHFSEDNKEKVQKQHLAILSLTLDVSPSRFLAFAWLLGGSLKEPVSSVHAAATWLTQEPVSSFYAFATWLDAFRRPLSCTVDTLRISFRRPRGRQPRGYLKNRFPACTQLPRDSPQDLVSGVHAAAT